MTNKDKLPSFQLLVVITTPKLAEKTADLFKQGLLPVQYRLKAEGTASSEIMDMLGLGSVDKCVLVSVIPKKLSDVMLDKLHSELQLETINSGVAFTIPITGANNLILRMLTQSAEGNNNQGREENIMAETKHVLIATVVNRGFSGDVMEAARAVGASGGTVIHSRQIGNEEILGFWGLSIQEEKEIVLILSEAHNKVPIMQNIGERCGIHSEAKGVIMSLPIDSVLGI